MTFKPRDPREIPVLLDAVDTAHGVIAPLDIAAVQSAVVDATLMLAEQLLHQAAKDIEAALFERIYDRLRAELPDIVDAVLKQQISAAAT
jgi:hypothetical protein